jgi:hypothetical protein
LKTKEKPIDFGSLLWYGSLAAFIPDLKVSGFLPGANKLVWDAMSEAIPFFLRYVISGSELKLEAN